MLADGFVYTYYPISGTSGKVQSLLLMGTTAGAPLWLASCASCGLGGGHSFAQRAASAFKHILPRLGGYWRQQKFSDDRRKAICCVSLRCDCES
eukprot:2637208-Pleurochrysis_carterae.AAC.2